MISRSVDASPDDDSVVATTLITADDWPVLCADASSRLDEVTDVTALNPGGFAEHTNEAMSGAVR